jgi:hypothetical protein
MKIFWGIVMILLPVMIIGLVITQFVISNELAAYGNRLDGYEQKISELMHENQILFKQLAVSRSLSSIENQAITAGFVKTTAYLQVQTDQPVALR